MAEQWRLLVVEGEENLNWNIVNSLQKDGYIVLGVTGGAEAIRTLWSEEYDIVICSQQMPDADGFDLLQWMRTYCPNARMIMLGMAGNGVNRTQALEMGVASYLEKPLDLHALKEELRRLLHQSGFSASLDSFDLLDVIQIITMSRKSIALVVNTGLEEQGILRFQGGELIWAEYGTLRGEEAFFALAAHKNGTVVHRPWNEQITPNLTLPLSRLIFQALQYRSKYAEYQQLSSELEAVKPGAVMPEPPAPFASALQDEVDDSPFQFVPDGTQLDAPYEQVWRNGSTNARLERIEVQSVESVPSDEQKKAWWEPTGPFPSLQASASMRAVTDGKPEQAFPRDGSVNITPSTVHKTGVGQNSALPSWLTDQPTHLDLPILRGNTGQIPIAPSAPSERSPVLPNIPLTGVPSSPLPPFLPSSPEPEVSAEWSLPAYPTGANPADAGLREIKPEESMFTTPHRAVKAHGSQSVPTEWQAPFPGTLPGQTGQLGVVKPSALPERKDDDLQSLAALPKSVPSAPLFLAPLASPIPSASPVEPQPARGGTRPLQLSVPEIGEALRADTRANTTEKRNYPALSAALQTLGYSVMGFIASAVVGLDGVPIAQVSVDETDISSLCAYLCGVVQSAAQVSESERGGACEHLVITSNTRCMILRALSKKKDIFQVLITTRETPAVESLEVLANVETALVSAL